MVKDNKILVNEIFESIDGEGYHSGYPTVFFRTTGCNLRCKWCDSKYTFEIEDDNEWLSVYEAINRVGSYEINHVTITGGEPLLDVNKEWMTKFIKGLLALNNEMVVDVETNGSIDYSYYINEFARYGDRFVIIMDWKARSSGMQKSMKKNNLKILRSWDLVKIVVQDEDFKDVEDVLRDTKEAQVYISPVFGKVTMEKIPEFVLKNKHYKNLRCQIQVHKIFWNPDKRGV